MSADSNDNNIGVAAEDFQNESLVSADTMMMAVDDLDTSAMSEF